MFGNEQLKQNYLEKMVNGEYIGCFAITEADSGSDTYQMKTTAQREGDYYTLNGSKMFISNGPIADLFVVMANTKDDKGEVNLTAFVVEKGMQGFTIGKEIEKMGLKSCPMSELIFEDCKVHKNNILLGLNKGKQISGKALQMERIFEFASHIGAMERQMDKCIRHVDERVQYNKKLKEFQAITHKISEMKVAIELSKLMLYKLAWLTDQNKKTLLDASIFKLYVSESYVKVCEDALQIFGAYGYSSEYSLERELRDSIASKIYSGTSEVQKNIIYRLTAL